MLPVRVLMVDDDVLYARRARLALDGTVELRVAQSRFEALAAVDRWSPELVILDLFFGDSDAFRLLDELRSTRPLLPLSVIYLAKGPGSSTSCQNDGDTFLGVIQRDAGIEELRHAVIAATSASRVAVAA